MKIVEIIGTLSSGGAERFVTDLCNQMAEMGHDVTLLLIKDPNEGANGFYINELSAKVYVESLHVKKYRLSTIWKVYSRVRKIKADVMHVHMLANVMMSAIQLWFHSKHTVCVVTSHIQAESEQSFAGMHWMKYFMLHCHRFYHVAISHQNGRSIEKVYGQAPDAIIYNGRTMITNAPLNPQVVEEVSQWKATPQTQVFTIIARCQAQKNIPRLVRCFNEMARRGHDVALLVIGDMYDNEIGLAAQRDALPHIHFLGTRHNVGDYLRASDFFTLSSDFEGMPITLIEALACGCIPVGTPVSGFNDVVIDGKNGFLAKDFSDEAYIAAIERALNEGSHIKRETLIALYQDKFSMEICAKAYLDLMEKAL